MGHMDSLKATKASKNIYSIGTWVNEFGEYGLNLWTPNAWVTGRQIFPPN